VSTVFPDKEVQVGNWIGLEEKASATYAVKPADKPVTGGGG
jgi:hypothetical protein